ncbi:MAG: tetraacyldisaccharide 4'-kinase [Bacteroidales bacterium]|nr:tetraacyldisaccharide 4'-kinase [Bacteroidales bacterium]
MVIFAGYVVTRVMLDKIILFPYSLTLAVKNALYRHGILKSTKASVPTVCVGNITAGGTGKTPHTEMILRTLLGSDDWAYSNIAVLSRGYKRKTRGFRKVTRDGAAGDFGDEPLQMAKKFPSVTVAVDRDRVEGCAFLADPELLKTSRKARKCPDKDIPKADIIVLDDAFQHRRLDASLKIVLVDYGRPLHKDSLLPLGRLRDLPSRIHEADMVIVTKCPAYLDEWERGKWAGYLDIKGYTTSTCSGTTVGGKRQMLFFSTIAYSPMRPVYEEADTRYTYSQRLILFTGIAKDGPLRNYLSDNYKIVKRFNFPDHHKYTPSDIKGVVAATKNFPTAVVATTEKDSQRITDTRGVPDSLKRRLFQVPIEVAFLTDVEKTIFEAEMLSRLKNLL